MTPVSFESHCPRTKCECYPSPRSIISYLTLFITNSITTTTRSHKQKYRVVIPSWHPTESRTSLWSMQQRSACCTLCPFGLTCQQVAQSKNVSVRWTSTYFTFSCTYMRSVSFSVISFLWVTYLLFVALPGLCCAV